MAGHSRSKNGVASRAYVPAIHAFVIESKTWMRGTSPRMTESMLPSSGTLEPLERLEDLLLARQRLVAFLALAVDHLLGRAGEEIGVVELAVDPLDVGLDLAELLLQPR